jgi:hypothetical protein
MQKKNQKKKMLSAPKTASTLIIAATLNIAATVFTVNNKIKCLKLAGGKV